VRSSSSPGPGADSRYGDEPTAELPGMWMLQHKDSTTHVGHLVRLLGDELVGIGCTCTLFSQSPCALLRHLLRPTTAAIPVRLDPGGEAAHRWTPSRAPTIGPTSKQHHAPVPSPLHIDHRPLHPVPPRPTTRLLPLMIAAAPPRTIMPYRNSMWDRK
jgi:hypothetical protein